MALLDVDDGLDDETTRCLSCVCPVPCVCVFLCAALWRQRVSYI